jgi:crossover junction endodeoxyribonuclease RusA
LHYRPATNRHRDVDSLVATSKPALDGCVDAGLIPRDTPEYVDHRMPVIHPYEKGKGAAIWLEVET